MYNSNKVGVNTSNELYVSYYDNKCIIVNKSCNDIHNIVHQCYILPTDIANIVNYYVEDEYCNVLIKDMYTRFATCELPHDILNMYEFDIHNTIVNINIHKDSKKVHFANISSINRYILHSSDRNTKQYIQYIPIANLILNKQMDNPCVSSTARYSVINNDVIILKYYDRVITLTIQNKQLFRKIIEIIDCIIEFLKKIDVINS